MGSLGLRSLLLAVDTMEETESVTAVGGGGAPADDEGRSTDGRLRLQLLACGIEP